MPTTIQEAVDSYLEGRNDLTPSSFENVKYRLKMFSRFSIEEGVSKMESVDNMHLHQYKVQRSAEVSNVTLKYHIGTLAQFLDWAEAMGLVEEGLEEFARDQLQPAVGHNEDVADYTISKKRAEEILAYLDKFKYATQVHVTFYVMWQTAMRISTIRALDVDDFGENELRTKHRPEQGTGLKNKERGERVVHIDDTLTRVIRDYLDSHHPMKEDEHGRTPLLGTSHGRAHETTIRKQIYKISRPCVYAECDQGRDTDECDAVLNVNASGCPGNVNPHAIRKGSITHHLNAEVPKEVVGDRADVSNEILDKHYDQATEDEKKDRRKGFLDGI